MRLYLDTNLWNIVLDQDLDAVHLMDELDRRNITLVLGLHALYEMTKTFYTGDKEAINRGQALLKSLERLIGAGLRCVSKETYECLVAEMYSLKGVAGTSKFLDYTDTSKVHAEIARLASGVVDHKWHTHTDDMNEASKKMREQVSSYLSNLPELSKALKGISTAGLSEWLTLESQNHTGRRLLVQHLGRHFPDVSTVELMEYSKALLKDDKHVVAHGLVRADLYYSWRCAHRGSNPRDLPDDMYHILNAAYCDMYATDDSGQQTYYPYLFKGKRFAFIYDRRVPLDEWLIGLGRHA